MIHVFVVVVKSLKNAVENSIYPFDDEKSKNTYLPYGMVGIFLHLLSATDRAAERLFGQLDYLHRC